MPNIQIANVSIAAQDFLQQMQEFDRMSARQPVDSQIVFAHDPVACACASYRAWTHNPGSRWHDLDTIVPEQQDIEKAEQLKRYYRERLVMESLTQVGDIKRSEFRRKLALLSVNELPITSREIGLLHRLPYFYQEDLDLDAVVAETNCQISQTFPGALTVKNYCVIPSRRMLKSRSAGEYYHYWFKDTTYNHPHSLVIKSDNPLRSLIDGIFLLPELRLNGHLFVKPFKGYHKSKQYYQLAEISLAS